MSGLRASPAGLAILAALFMGTLGSVKGATAGSTVLGDTNCDGGVNALDAAFVLQYAAGLTASMPCLENADTNSDGAVNPLDAALILQVGAGIISDLGPQVPSPFTTFGDGTHVVGTDVRAGTYRTRADSGGCYWARLSGFGGTLGEIIANDFGVGPQVVTVAPGDVGFESSRCGTWTSDLSAISSSLASPFGDGTFIVGVDVGAGTWRSDGGDCYWARLSGFSGTFGDIIANDFGGNIVTISASDAGFTTSGCGSWTKLS